MGRAVAQFGGSSAVRFDDMLATLLSQPAPTAPARAAAWRQIVDVIAQGRTGSGILLDEAYDRLRALRADIPSEILIETTRALCGRRLPSELVALFADEAPSIVAPLIAEVVLDEEEWLALLPSLTPTTRGLLRHRRDLPSAVVRALGSFGASDFMIAPPEHVFIEEVEQALPEDVPAAPQSPVLEGDRQIKDLLSRIAAFRARGPRHLVEAPAPEEAEVGDFRFETAADGVIIWVDGAPRGPLIGETIAVAASSSDHGVDGHAAGAYRRRAPFRDARLSIAGDSVIAGEWRISAVPFFEPRDGRFTGYRGTARRPRADETAQTAPAPSGVFGTGIEADSLSQLVHELRTPLNAILGFSEMIERQYRGPAASDYRGKAADIVSQGQRMLAAIDDLDIAARVESRRLAIDDGTADTSALLSRLHADYLAGAQARGVALAFRIEADLPPARIDTVAVERMFARLLAATIAIAAPSETVRAELARAEDGTLRLSVARPRMLKGRDETMLLDPGYNPDGDWPDAPVLGLGFALRLVRNLANAAGGRLDIEEDRFVLRLPLRAAAPQAGEGGA
jgi:signal transduction histidine kinase